MKRLVVDAAEAGARVDLAVAGLVGASRREAWRLLGAGRVALNGRTLRQADKGTRVEAGDALEVAWTETEGGPRAMANPQLRLEVAARGEGWLIANKPSGMPVHPLRAGETATLLNAVIARHPEIHGVGEAGLRSGVVHRLDVETSGLVLLALDDERWRRFRTAFAEHRVGKTYMAMVLGEPAGEGEAVMHLAVGRHRPARVRVVEAGTRGSRACSLRWRVRERRDGVSLVEVDLHTGFLHQIRVMFAAMGHAVLGDKAYGGKAAELASRLMLHATRLVVDEQVRAEAQWRDELVRDASQR